VRRLRVLQIFSRYLEFGGEEGSVFRIGDALQAHHDVEYFIGSSEDLLGNRRAPSLLAPLRAWRNQPVALRLRRYQEVGRFDFWLIHNVLPGLSPSVYRTAFSLGIPVIHYLHNYRLGCANGFFLNHGSPCERCLPGNFWPAFQTACWKNSRWISGFMGLILRNIRQMGLFSEVAAWIALSEAQKQKHVAMGIPANRIHVIHHFYQSRQPPPPPSPAGDFLFLGRLSSEKGVDLLLRAWAKTHHRGPKLVIAGAGPEESRLRKLANELGLRNIVFTGFVEKGRQAELWANSVALVVPSIWDEPFGMVVLEAWAHARPVVAFAKGALPELIRHNSDGLLAEPFSESSLAANMKLLLDHPSKATAMGRAGMFRLQNEFTQQNWLKKIQGVYEIVLDRGLSPKG
jgi:glycosyltransferase involved in cell wall biosynthesis